jgi:glycosyltransferase involved in cell wall biosynthesis
LLVETALPTASVGAIAWTDTTRRAAELAGVLGGRAVMLDGFGLRGRRTAPLRWLLNAARTIAWFARWRPRVLIVQNPPIVLALLGLALTRLRGGVLVLDSHPASFGLKGRRVWRLLLPLHRFVARRSAAVLVTVQSLADEVERWGGTALLVHEAPPGTAAEPADAPRPARDNVEVLLVAVFASDEPVDVALEAARLVPEVTLKVTGDLARAGDLPARAPENVVFVGYLNGPDYAAAVRSADAVMALTTENTSVMRAGYEAVYARRPLIVSDWPVAAEVFPYAVRAANTPEGIAAALRTLAHDLSRLDAQVDSALVEQQARWQAQQRALAACCGVA